MDTHCVYQPGACRDVVCDDCLYRTLLTPKKKPPQAVPMFPDNLVSGPVTPIYHGLKKPKTLLPTDATERKACPVTTGVLDYFPDAVAAVAHASKVGNDQHNPGQPLHWAKEKSTDHADCLVRHLIERGTVDTDGVRHSAKVAWRALALLQTEIEQEKK